MLDNESVATSNQFQCELKPIKLTLKSKFILWIDDTNEYLLSAFGETRDLIN